MENKTKEDLNILKEALYDTASVHSINQARGALEKLILNNNIDCFTRNNNARENLIQIGLENVKKVAIKRYVDLVIRDPIDSKNPLEEAMKRTFRKYEDNPRIYALGTIELLLKKCLTEEKSFFVMNENARDNLNNYFINNNLKLSEFVGNSIAKKVTDYLLLEKQEEINNDIQTISNVQTYPSNIEQLRSAIISGTRMKREGTISLGQDLQACSSIGNIRKNQEDAVLLIKHPLKPEFKMMVVADGMGGLESGEEASNKVVENIKMWFEGLDVSYFEKMDGLEENLKQELQIISDELYSKFEGRAGSTFVGAIIGENETLISNVGDSRAYAIEDTRLIQITEDHSYVNDLFMQGKINHPDDMRFHVKNNAITQCIGKGAIQPNFYTWKNAYYDSILLLSDGVTDCLSDSDILAITRYTDRTRLAKNIVESALKYDSISPIHLHSNPDYNKIIPAGKDNATAAVFTKGIEKGPIIKERYNEDIMER